MQECDMVMVPEMMPTKVQMCKNVTRYEDKSIMKCKLGMKKMKKYFPEKKCTKVAAGVREKCVDMVKLQEEKHEVKKCSFHPKTVCRPVTDMKCKTVKKKMC